MRRRISTRLQNHALALRLFLTAELRPRQEIDIGLTRDAPRTRPRSVSLAKPLAALPIVLRPRIERPGAWARQAASAVED